MSFRHLKKVFSANTERVKSLEYHPTEPLLAAATIAGTILIYNTNDYSLLKTIRLPTGKPIRCARWMTCFNWIICAGDDQNIYAYDYNSGALVTSILAHDDFIRSLAVHPTQPLVLSASDDYKIKLFKVANNKFTHQKTYVGHNHFVMDIKFNPKDPNTFATASIDTYIKFWNIHSSEPRYTLEGHKAGVNCIEFMPGNSLPYIAAGDDEFKIKIWDYHNKNCITTLDGHSGNVTALKFHPIFPLLISTSEDHIVRLWNTQPFRYEAEFSYGKERGWTIDCTNNSMAIGFDQGLIAFQLGKSGIVAAGNAKGVAYWAVNNEIKSMNVSKAGDIEDGTPVEAAVKDIVTMEYFPSSIAADSRNRYIAVVGENSYGVYSTLGGKGRLLGAGREFVWGTDMSFAVRTANEIFVWSDSTKIGDPVSFRPPEAGFRIFGGRLLGVADDSSISFFAWDEIFRWAQDHGDRNSLDWDAVRAYTIEDIETTGVWWSPLGDMVAIAEKDSVYILAFDEGADSPEDAFAEEFRVDGKALSGCWSENAFFFSDNTALYAVVAHHIELVARLERPMSVVCYVQAQERVFLCDKEYNFVSYLVPQAFVEAVCDATFEEGPVEVDLPDPWRGRFAAILEELQRFSDALAYADSDDKRFSLALRIPDVRAAIEIARKTGSAAQWQQIASLAMRTGELGLLREATRATGDEAGALLIASASGNRREMAALSRSENRTISFAARFASGDIEGCIRVLLDGGRYPEAALMARTYKPELMEACAREWQRSLREKGDTRTAESIALPSEYPNLFPDAPPQRGLGEDPNPKESENEVEDEDEEDVDVDDVVEQIAGDDEEKDSEGAEAEDDDEVNGEEDDDDMDVDDILNELEEDED